MQETSVFSLLSPSGSVCRLFEEVFFWLVWAESMVVWFSFHQSLLIKSILCSPFIPIKLWWKFTIWNGPLAAGSVLNEFSIIYSGHCLRTALVTASQASWLWGAPKGQISGCSSGKWPQGGSISQCPTLVTVATGVFLKGLCPGL